MRSASASAVTVVLSFALAATSYAQGTRAARTPWGDPDLQGVYSNINEQRVPMERPDRFAGRSRDSITVEELRRLAAESNAAALSRGEAAAFGGLSPLRFDLRPSRAVAGRRPDRRQDSVTDATGGAAAAGIRRHAIARPLASAADSNLWYRCISIGVPRSMMPLVDGATFRFVQSPGYVAIQYEMMHETRVVPLTGGAHVAGAVTAVHG